MEELSAAIIESWIETEGRVCPTEEILEWVNRLNNTVQVDIKKIPLEQCKNWFFDEKEGIIRNSDYSFFQIAGLQNREDKVVLHEQPIIIQDEIGYLGILCKKIKGVLHFLMQAKIEPGNLNKIQISPTIQATKSNFTQKHGGKKPSYLEYFLHVKQHRIIVDQIQSEQSSRFYKKRNRNIVIMVEDEVEVLSSHKWMTLGQIKELMKIDNLVNMDSRTVLSCIPLEPLTDELALFEKVRDKALFQSIFSPKDRFQLPEIYSYINDYKMFEESQASLVPLFSLTNWSMKNNEFTSSYSSDFKLIFCEIFIEGREVKQWCQPLFEAIGIATFGLITSVKDGERLFLVKGCAEIGCFDKMELGATIQVEPTFNENRANTIEQLFFNSLKGNKNILNDVILSEEGGRFYHEQNRNIIIEIDYNEITTVPRGYFWVNYKTLNRLVQVNNVLNIQLRNLLSILNI